MAKNSDAWEAKFRAEFHADHVQPVEDAVAACESPIERVLFRALLGGPGGFVHYVSACRMPLQYTELPGVAPEDGHLVDVGGDVTVVPQLTVITPEARYRIDLAMECRATVTDGPATVRLAVHIAIECDGHDYHERTKEQAERDKSRDRALQGIGWHIARFTGSEIIRDPYAAAGKVYRLSNDILRLKWQAGRTEGVR